MFYWIAYIVCSFLFLFNTDLGDMEALGMVILIVLVFIFAVLLDILKTLKEKKK